MPAGQEPAVDSQVVTIQSPALVSSAFHADCRVLELHCDAVCHVKFSTEKDSTPATTSHKRMPAGATQFFSVSPGHILSVIEGV